MHCKLTLVALAFAFTLGSHGCGGRSARPVRGVAPSAMAERAMCPAHSTSGSDSPEEAPAAMDSESYQGDDGDDCWVPAAPSRQDEINKLWNEIRETRLRSGMSAEPLTSETSRLHPLSVQEVRKESEHEDPKTQVCIDTCKIEDSICKNADKICRLAGELGNDAWAIEKCDSGKASCDDATKKCADCVAGENVTPSR